MVNRQQTTDLFETKIANKLFEVECTAFNVLDVINVVKKMKLGQCHGPDGIHMEALHYGGSVYVLSYAYCLTCA